MSFIVTVRMPGRPPRTYTAIGNRDALMDAAYDGGALGVTVMVPE